MTKLPKKSQAEKNSTEEKIKLIGKLQDAHNKKEKEYWKRIEILENNLKVMTCCNLNRIQNLEKNVNDNTDQTVLANLSRIEFLERQSNAVTTQTAIARMDVKNLDRELCEQKERITKIEKAHTRVIKDMDLKGFSLEKDGHIQAVGDIKDYEIEHKPQEKHNHFVRLEEGKGVFTDLPHNTEKEIQMINGSTIACGKGEEPIVGFCDTVNQYHKEKSMSESFTLKGKMIKLLVPSHTRDYYSNFYYKEDVEKACEEICTEISHTTSISPDVYGPVVKLVRRILGQT